MGEQMPKNSREECWAVKLLAGNDEVSDGPEYDSPGAFPEKDGMTKEEFLATYPDCEGLAEIYYGDE